jgi:hypothetical protein
MKSYQMFFQLIFSNFSQGETGDHPSTGGDVPLAKTEFKRSLINAKQ